MKSNAHKRILASLMIVATCWLPCVSVACLSGAEQEGIANAALGTGTEMVTQGLINTASVSTGNALADAFWNGGANWFFRGLQTIVNARLFHGVDDWIPDDPFP